MRGMLAWIYLCIFVGFFALGLLGLAFGLLPQLDRWLDANAARLDAAGSLVLNVLWGAVLVVCAFVIAGGLWRRFMAPLGEMGDAADFDPAEGGDLVQDTRPAGWGCMVVALILGYFAWFGMTA